MKPTLDTELSGATPARAPARRLFLIESVAAGDALLRILEPFALQQAMLSSVAYDAAAVGVATIRVEAEGLTDERAETLRRRLQKLPLVASVALGWQS